MRFALFLLSLATAMAAEESVLTARILFLNGPQAAAGPFYLFDGLESQEVELPRFNLSPVYELRPGELRLWLLSKPVADAKGVPEGAPSVLVPTGVTDAYLICTVDPANKVIPIQMRLVDADSEKIGRGEMLWFNLTAKAIAGKVGSRDLLLGAKSTALVKEPATVAGDYPIELYFRVEGDERTHPLIEGQWRHDPRTRSLVFVYDEGKRRAPRVMSFYDFRMDPKHQGE